MKITISQRLSLGFAFLVLLTVILGLWSVTKINSISQATTDLYLHPLVVSNAVRDIRADIFAMENGMKGIAFADSDHDIQVASGKVAQFEQDVLQQFDVVSEQFLGDKNRVEAFQKRFLAWKISREKVIAAALQGDHKLAAQINKENRVEYVDAMSEDIRYMVNFANEKAKSFYGNAEGAAKQAEKVTYSLLVIISLISAVVSLLIVKNITTPLAAMVANLKKITAGNLEDVGDVNRSDEIGEVAASIGELRNTLKNTARRANVIAAGDYSAEVAPRSEFDELGTAMQTMTRSLREMSLASITKDWLDNGQVELNKQLRGELPLEEICSRIINFLVKYIDAQIGALYVRRDGKVLHLQSSYAYSSRKKISNSYSFGQGLVGQAALEKNHILISPCPADYIHIESGLGEAVPTNILVYPVVMNNEVKGVIELGSFKAFSERDLLLLSQVQEGIAITLNSVESRARQDELLHQTQQQAEELRAQEEELKQTNEELREQSETLKESEQKLQIQQEELRASNEELAQQAEELRVSNEELGEKSEILEKQRADLHRAKNEIEEKAKAVELASKYKSEFLANMSHELRSPLNSLLILAKSLAGNEDGNLSEEQVEAATIIHSGGLDLLNLINDILDLSKAEAGRLDINPGEVRFPPLLYDLKNQFKALAQEKGLDFSIELAPELPEAMFTDEQRLKQILKNLLSNAIKFTSQGSVHLKIKQLINDFKGSGQEHEASEVISFSVTDTGIGIPLDKQKAIFEAFQQADGSTSRRFGGTGLGLTISRRLAKLLGGEIAIASTERIGAAFTLLLPVGSPSTDQISFETAAGGDVIYTHLTTTDLTMVLETGFSATSHPQEFIPDDREQAKDGDKSVLIIEDDKEFAKILVKMAREKGYKALAAGDGRSGMFMAHTYRPKAIILDLGLPDVAGGTVLEHIKGHLSTRHIPIHVISANNCPPDIRQKGALGFLSKPVSAEDLSRVFSQFDTFFVEGGKKLLVVEDDPISCRHIIKILNHPGIKIVTASTGQEAMDILSSQVFDCVVLDLTLPDMTGFEMLRRLEQTDHFNREMPVIIYTGREMTSDENDLLQLYARTVVVKGVESTERLVDEVSLFLHSVTSTLPQEQQKIIHMIHDKDEVLRSKKILLVDDDMRNVFALSGIMTKNGMQVVMAANGEQALEKLKTEKDVDLILMDIMMPVMDGYEAMRKIREQAVFRNLPIIALTAKAMPEDRILCMDAGASDYLTKPVEQDRLFSVMRVWLFK